MKLRKLTKLAVLFLIASLAISAISVDRLKGHITWLADPARNGRHAGTPGGAAAADYIQGKLKEIGYTTQLQDFGGNRRNVIGRWGTADKHIVIGAHYDGQGAGHPSASDNASGVAVVLELARELKEDQVPVSVIAIAFDDEEQGLNGSRYYVDHPLVPVENTVAAIIFDTLGRSFLDLSSWTLFVMGAENSKELASVVQKRMRPEMLMAGMDLIGPRSDFAAFAMKRVPYLFFTNATHKDYHGEGDSANRIDYPRMAQDAAVIAQIVKDVARLTTRPRYLDDPIYPTGEGDALINQLAVVERERADLSPAYKLMFGDLRVRLKASTGREAHQMAATALLALATPRLSPFMLSYYLGPFYEGENKREIAAAIYEEAARWSEGAMRRELEQKAKALRGGSLF